MIDIDDENNEVPPTIYNIVDIVLSWQMIYIFLWEILIEV